MLEQAQMQFISPNLRHVDGKIYYLSKDEIKNKIDYINENYYYNIDEINKNFDDYKIELVVNDYTDRILVKCIFNENSKEKDYKLNELCSKINMDICDLKNHGEKYDFSV